MADFTTSEGNDVTHLHIGDPGFFDSDLDAADIEVARAIVAGYSSANEVEEPTLMFNCHGFAYTEAHGWFNSPRKFNDDDVTRIPFEDARRGDIVSYRKSNRLKHSGIVERVNDGLITRVRSKWGAMATVIHDLNDVPAAYGSPEILRRPNS